MIFCNFISKNCEVVWLHETPSLSFLLFCSYRLRLSKISNICLLLLGFSLFIRIFISGNPWFSAWLFYINSCTTILFPPESARALHFAFICPYAKHIFAIHAYAVLHFSGFTPPFPPFFTSDSSFLVYLVHLCLSSAHHWHTHRVFSFLPDATAFSLTPPYSYDNMDKGMPLWWNGRHRGLKIPR